MVGKIRLQNIKKDHKKLMIKELTKINDNLIDTQSIHTLYTIKAHYEHSQNRNLTFAK